MKENSVIWDPERINNIQPMDYNKETPYWRAEQRPDGTFILDAVEQYFMDAVYGLVSGFIMGTLKREEYILLGSGDEGIFFCFTRFGFARAHGDENTPLRVRADAFKLDLAREQNDKLAYRI